MNFSVISSRADCNQFNVNGQYTDVECAKSFALEELKNEKTPYIKMDNVGENSEYTSSVHQVI